MYVYVHVHVYVHAVPIAERPKLVQTPKTLTFSRVGFSLAKEKSPKPERPPPPKNTPPQTNNKYHIPGNIIPGTPRRPNLVTPSFGN